MTGEGHWTEERREKEKGKEWKVDESRGERRRKEVRKTETKRVFYTF